MACLLIKPKNKLLLCIFVFFFSLGSQGLFSQKDYIRFKRISTEHGLSQVTINCILKEKEGFMWFGTQDGLNRYDGYEFKVYRHDPDDDTTLSDNYIWCICEDQSSVLWIGTNDGGLNKFDPKTDKFKRYTKSDSQLSHNFVRCLHEDRSGILWIGTNGGGLNKFDPKKGVFLHCYRNDGKDSSLSDDRVIAICEDKDNVLWIGTYGGGLNKFDRKTERFTHYKHDTENPKSLSNDKVMVIHKTESGVLWLGTEGGGLNIMVDRERGKFESYTTGNSGLSHNEIRAICEDQYRMLWIGTEGGGLNTFDQDGKHRTNYQYNAADQCSLSHNDVRSIYEDESGVIWIGTYTGGLNKFNRESKNFALYQNNATDQNSLSNNDVRSICEDKFGALWIGTYGGGLNKMTDRDKGKFKRYTTGNSDLSHNDIKCLHKDRSGALWIGTRGGGLNKFNPTTEKFTNFKHNPYNSESLSHDDVRCLFRDRSGELWIGTEGGGLNRLIDPENGQFEQYRHSDGDKTSLSHDIVFSIYEDRSDVLWIGTRGGGLNKMIDRKQGKFKSYTTKSGTKDGLSHNFVLSIYEDREGVLWIGTFGGGLNKMLDREEGIFEPFGRKDGLPNNVIYGILEDKKGNLWLSSNGGISKFNPGKKTFRNYDFNDGLQSNEFNAGAYFKNKEGKMFFGGVNGFNSFSPEKIIQKKYIPPVIITDFLILNESVKSPPQEKNTPLRYAFNEKKESTLSQNQNSFQFKFAAFYYGNPHKNRYKYKLEGRDNDWNETNGQNRVAKYFNISPGSYVFKVRGSTEDGKWGSDDEYTSVKIKISGSIWKTWWAYTFYSLVFIALILSAWFAWSKRYLKQKVKKRTNQLIRAEKMAALGTLVANVAHEINNPTGAVHTTAYNLTRDLTKLKTFLNELAGEDADDEILAAFNEKFGILFGHLDTINDSTNRIAKIVKTLRFFSREGGKMKPVNVQEGIKATIALAKTKYKEQVDFITDFQTPIEIEANAGELNQVYMNIIENACYSMVQKQKNSGDNLKGTLTVQVRQENGHAVIRFKDTGSGISEEVQRKMFDPFFSTKPEGEGTGLGLAISYSVVEKHGGRFEVDSQEGQGTVITLYLPLERKDTIEKTKISQPKRR